MPLNESQAEDFGIKLIQLLGLHVKTNDRVDTADGDKTPEGLGKTIERYYHETLGVEGKRDSILRAARDQVGEGVRLKVRAARDNDEYVYELLVGDKGENCYAVEIHKNGKVEFVRRD